MSDLTLRINADPSQASKAFKELAGESEELRGKMEKMAKSYGEGETQKFIDKQKLLEISLKGTRGEVAAMTTAQNAYQHKIESLIRSGLDPESDAVKKLRAEQEKLKDKIDAATKAQELQEKAAKAAAGALVAIGAAVAGLGAYSVKAAADLEDMTAAFTPLMGSAEKASALVKQISMEAAKTPFEISKIGDSVKALLPAFSGSSQEAMNAFRMIGDTAQGNSEKLSSITNAYSKVMLTGKVSMQELNSMANAGVPIYDELAKSMGVSVAEMMKLSSSGKITSKDLTDAFQKMTGEGGIFFKGMEVSSTTFSSTLLGVKENLNIVAGTIGEQLLPKAKEIAEAVYNATRGFIEWINEGNNLEDLLTTVGIAAGSAAAGLTAFIVVAKGKDIIDDMKKSLDGLKIALTGALGPAALVAAGVTAVVAVGLALNKMYDDQQHAGERAAAAMKKNSDAAGNLLSEYKRLNPGKALDKETTDKLIQIYPELNELIRENATTVEEAATAMKTLNEQKALEMAQDYIKKIQKMTEETERLRKANESAGSTMVTVAGQTREIKNSYNIDIVGLEKNIKQVEEQTNAVLAGVGKKYENGVIVDIPVTLNTDTGGGESGGGFGGLSDRIEKAKKTLQQQLSDIPLTSQQQLNDDSNTIKAHLQQRVDLQLENSETMAELNRLRNEEEYAQTAESLQRRKDLEQLASEERIAAVRQEYETLQETLRQNYEAELIDKTQFDEQKLAAKTQFDEQMVAAEQAYNAAIAQEDLNLVRNKQEISDALVAIKKRELAATAGLMGSLSDLVEAAGQESRGAAIASKALSSAQAAINSYLAYTEALATAPWPANIVAAATVLASGLAQQIKILSTPIPSAETGGRFIVPNTSTRVDDKYMRFNGGEEIEVTPRGETGTGRSQNFTFKIGEQAIFDIVNHGRQTGDIVFDTAGNL
jgi:tape measure domain-containing protein